MSLRGLLLSASYPKPDDERRNPNPPKFGWRDLPANGREGDPPLLPERPEGAKEWLPETVEAWNQLWTTPQAVAWDQSGRTLHVWAVLHNDMGQFQADRKPVPASLLSELRQIEDRHGLSPKAMLQLRWRVIEDFEQTPIPGGTGLRDRKKATLKVLEGGA